MELILFICSREASRYIRLIPQAAATQTIYLQQNSFGLRETLELSIRRDGKDWYFTEHNYRTYQIYEGGKPAIYRPLQNQTVLQIKTVYREQLCILAFTDIHVCKAFKLYSLLDQTYIPIGKQENNAIQYECSGLVSSFHTCLNYVNHSWTISNHGLNGTYLNGKKVTCSHVLKYGDIIDLFGLRVMYLKDAIAILSYGKEPVICETIQPCGGLSSDGTGAAVSSAKNRIFHRAPRMLLRPVKEVIELDAPPSAREPYKRPVLLTIGPALTMAIPMLLGFFAASYGMKARGQSGGTYMYTGLITAVTSALLGSVWALLNVKNEQKRYDEAENLRNNAYKAYLHKQEKLIRKKYEEHGNILHSMYPSARDVCRYDENTHVLWNRNSMHADFLQHRIGLGEMLFQTEIRIPKEKFEIYEDSLQKLPEQLTSQYHLLHDVPYCIDLDLNRLVGVIEEGRQREILTALAVQLAAQHAYTDVKMVCLLDGRYGADGYDSGYLRWLPHVWSEDKKVRFVNFGDDHAEELLYELCQIFRRRLELPAAKGEQQIRQIPHYVVLIENYKRLEEALPLQYLFTRQRECGLTTVLFAEGYEVLPNECSYVVQKNSQFTGVYELGIGEPRYSRVNMDIVTIKEAEQLARRLCPIETTEPEMSARLPDSVTLYEMLQITDPEELHIERNWAESRPDLYLKAAIGMKSGGGICYLDVHEKAHGPHGLIAGMTGSGKSELLQTYIIAMAVRYRPEEVGFFLIDYKGGGMANLFLKLPHLLGHISNLSGTMVRRAMVSIRSENKRRQEIFNRYHVNHIHEYIRLYRASEVDEPLPHILIIIDEFAELKKEEPDFMKELISVAQVGRSLGVHLILATQKPAGTVDDNIRSNARFRLCLRVQDRQDSTDMLHKADAAYITQAGRAYFQVGNDELYELFQCGYGGAPYEQVQNGIHNAAALIELTGREDYCGHHQRNSPRTEETTENGHTRTQLEATIEKLCRVQEKIKGGKVRCLWLPMLPERIFLSDLDGYGFEPESDREEIVVPVGKYDHPQKQIQGTLYIRLTEGGHHLIFGMVTSGKSTFLQTLLYALVTKYAPERLNLYVIDCSSHFLSPFKLAPHTGGFMGENELGEMRKTIHLLHRVLEERKKLLQGGNYRQYVKSVAVLPAMVLVIDNYAIFKERTEGCFEGDLMEFSRIGESYGIYLVITAAGTGAGEVSARMAENFRSVICLRMTDRYQYAGVLRIPRTEIVPEQDVYGRGLAWAEGELLEFQTALAVEEPDDYARLEQLEEHCRALHAKWEQKGTARKVPVIPAPLTTEVFLQQTEETQRAAQDQLPIGYFTETAELCVLNMMWWFCLTISGRSITESTDLLKLLIETQIRSRTLVYIIDTEEGRLKDYCEREDDSIAGYYSQAEEIYAFCEKLGEEFRQRNERKTVLKKAGKSRSEIYHTLCENQRCFVIIADLGEWVSGYYRNQLLRKAEPLMFNLLEKGELHNIYFAAAFRQESYPEVTGRRMFDAYSGYRTGIRMCGHAGEERILDFSYINYSEQDRPLMQGYGMVPQMESEVCTAKGQIVIPIL